jgi:YrbI family 3-deoxy-D-manno-octulosonate 8-phosphate phosphatase
MDLDERCEPIELVLADVDGVLTDGQVVYNNQGIETKRFHIRDGLGIKLWHKAGYKFGLVTQRSSQIVKLRAAELNVTIVRQGTQDKLATLKEVLAELRLSAAQACYIGDDLPDLPVMRVVGLSVAVADACEEVRRAAHFTTCLGGGQGAVRETLEWILKAQRRWDDVIHPYLT